MIEQNLIKLFEHSFKNNWELPAYTNYFRKVTLTYGDSAKQIAKLHLLFEQVGIKTGDKIALIGRNTPNWTLTYVAVVTYGAVIVPILQDFNANDVHHIVNHSDSVLLFCSDKIWDKLDEDKMENILAVISLNDFSCMHQNGENDVQSALSNLNESFNAKYPNGYTADDIQYAERSNSELAMISYTSGTTGFSKGVMLTANSLAGNITYGIKTRLLERGNRVLNFLPLAHAYGMAFDFLTATCCGAHTYLLNKIPSPKVLIKAFGEIKPNVIFTVPLILEKLYRKQIQPMLEKKSMQFMLNVPLLDSTILATINKKLTETFGGEFSEVIIGGAALNPEAEEFFKKIGFRFTVGYGMTECAPLISHSFWHEFKLHSVGKVLPTMEAKILSNDPQNEVGEILVRGENVMLGYYKNEEATRLAIDEDGWLHTGDMGTMDFDGTIYIKGRNKNMLLGPSGQNIYPEEIENKLNNMPFVMESLVLQNAENKLVALVVPDYDAMDEAKLTTKDLEGVMEENRKELNATTAAYESITKIQIYPSEFEKTPKKSIKRFLYVNQLK